MPMRGFVSAAFPPLPTRSFARLLFFMNTMWQIDNLRERDNVLILTTSNVSEAIDLAFFDRADIKQ